MEKKTLFSFVFVLSLLCWMSDWHSFWLELQRERSTDDWWYLQMFSAVTAKKKPILYIRLRLDSWSARVPPTFFHIKLKILIFSVIWQRCQNSLGHYLLHVSHLLFDRRQTHAWSTTRRTFFSLISHSHIEILSMRIDFCVYFLFHRQSIHSTKDNVAYSHSKTHHLFLKANDHQKIICDKLMRVKECVNIFWKLHLQNLKTHTSQISIKYHVHMTTIWWLLMMWICEMFHWTFHRYLFSTINFLQLNDVFTFKNEKLMIFFCLDKQILMKFCLKHVFSMKIDTWTNLFQSSKIY